MYDPKQYWETRGRNYQHSEDWHEMENLHYFVKDLIGPEDKMLEVGSGYGRIYEYLNSVGFANSSNFSMCDFTDSFINTCAEKTGIQPTKWDGQHLPYADSSFELVISFSVFLHVPHDKIREALKEHIRVSSKYVFIATFYTDSCTWPLSPHMFLHNYPLLFSELGLNVVKEIKCHLDNGNYLRRNWMLEKVG